MEIFVSNIILIKHPCKPLIDWCIRYLTFRNPEYDKKVHMGFYIGKTPKFIRLYSYDRDKDELELPSGCFDYIKVFMNNFKSTFCDYRVAPKVNISSKINLRDYQSYAQTVFNNHDNALISLFCGGGKTEIALALAAKLGVKTLFLTHTQDLVNQANERCSNRLVCSRSFIKEGNVDLSGDVVFALVQTLSNKIDEVPPDTFGLVIVDECHKTAVNTETIGMFRTCIEHFASKYKLGLSATLSRSDGLACCIPYIIGQVIYNVQEEGENYVGYLENKEVIRFSKSKFQVPAHVTYIPTGFKLTYVKDGVEYYRDVFNTKDGTISFAKLLNELSQDTTRNNMIIETANKLNTSTLILSDRVEQLNELQKGILNSVVVTGKTPKKQREQALKDVSDGKIKVLLASYKIAKEGLDVKILSNLIFATPVKDMATVVQSVGRIQRPFDGKTIANVYDFTDDDVSTLIRFHRHRNTIYKKKGWL